MLGWGKRKLFWKKDGQRREFKKSLVHLVDYVDYIFWIAA